LFFATFFTFNFAFYLLLFNIGYGFGKYFSEFLHFGQKNPKNVEKIHKMCLKRVEKAKKVMYNKYNRRIPFCYFEKFPKQQTI